MKTTIKEILLKWLASNKIGTEIAYHNLEQTKQYGQLFFGVMHNVGSYDRIFRLLLNDEKSLKEYGIRLVKIPKDNITYDKWRIEKYDIL